MVQIMIVEDEGIVALDIQDSLERLGYAVSAIASSGEQALCQLASVRPDLILMDIMLEGEMDGVATAEQVRSRFDLPIVFLTAYADQQTLERARTTGPFAYLVKPFEEQELHTTIEIALYKHRTEETLRHREAILAAVSFAAEQFFRVESWQDRIEDVLERLGAAAGVSRVYLYQRSDVPCMPPVLEGDRQWPAADDARSLARLLHANALPRWNGVLSRGEILQATVDDLPFGERKALQEIGVQSAVVMPIFCDETWWGVIGFDECERQRTWQSAEIEALKTAANTLGAAIRRSQLRSEIEEQNEQLWAQNAELEAFAHTVAHDLKNPLSLIMGFGGLLQEHPAAKNDREMFESLQQIVHSGRRMQNIIDELLLLAGVRKAQVTMARLDMACIVDQAQQRLVNVIAACQAQIALPDRWPGAVGYAPWVEEVWVNYLSNALKYGGDPPQIALGAGPASASPPGFVRFWVRDNGGGLSQEERAGLFVPFTRLDQIETEGHGLGLSIVRRIIDRLGGEVGVDSVEGEGSTFYFTLPTDTGTSPDIASREGHSDTPF